MKQSTIPAWIQIRYIQGTWCCKNYEKKLGIYFPYSIRLLHRSSKTKEATQFRISIFFSSTPKIGSPTLIPLQYAV